jgi:hypothetical protein
MYFWLNCYTIPSSSWIRLRMYNRIQLFMLPTDCERERIKWALGRVYMCVSLFYVVMMHIQWRIQDWSKRGATKLRLIGSSTNQCQIGSQLISKNLIAIQEEEGTNPGPLVRSFSSRRSSGRRSLSLVVVPWSLLLQDLPPTKEHTIITWKINFLNWIYGYVKC